MQNTSPLWKWMWTEGGKALPSAAYSGAVVSFDNPGYTYPEAVTVSIDPVQDLHGYGHPWPAGGGKNLLNPGESQTVYGITKIINADGTITFNGTATATADFYFNDTTSSYNEISLPTGDYSLKGSENGGDSTYNFFWIYKKNDTIYYANGRDHTIVTVDGPILSRIFFRVYVGYTINLTVKLELSLKSYQAGSWTPYSNICPISGWTGANVVVSPTADPQDGTTYPISWQSEAGTVYGGTLDVTTGLLTVTMALLTFNNDLWTIQNATTNIYLRLPNSKAGDILSDVLKNGTSSGQATIVESNHRLYIWNGGTEYGITTREEAQEFFNGHQLVYELATPQTYQLTPVQIALLFGTNNVWADAGDTTVLLDSPGNVWLEARATIAGTVYTEISAPIINRAAMQSKLSVGNVASASLQISVRGATTIPRSAEVVIEVRLNDGTTTSEWLPQGTFYVSRRARDPVTGVVALECYDALLKANAVLRELPWTTESGVPITTSTGAFITFGAKFAQDPSMQMLANDIALLLGVTLDPRTVINTGSEYVISKEIIENGATIRDILGAIAMAHGGNWTISPAGKLRLVPIMDAADAEDAETDVVDVDGITGALNVGQTGMITGIRDTREDSVYLVGDESGIVVDVSLSAQITVDVAEEMIGMEYQSYSLAGAVCDPAAELGDYVRAGANGEISSALYSQQITLGPACRSDIAALEPGELTDEYPYIEGSVRTLAIAKTAAMEAATVAATEAVENLDQQTIFNRLTNNGAAQGVILYNGQLYINASYIKAGQISVGLIDFTNYDNYEFLIPNEYDATTLFSNQSIVDGWITQTGNTITVVECNNATELQGKRIVVSVETKTPVEGGSTDYENLEGGGSEIWVAPAYGQEDAEGNLIGATGQGEFYRYETSWVVPDGVTWFSISFDTTGARAIRVSADTASDFAFMYGNNVAISYKGLQVGKFVVDKSGNVTSGARNQFDGDVDINGELSVNGNVCPSGSFTTADGKTVAVTNGIITNIT